MNSEKKDAYGSIGHAMDKMDIEATIRTSTVNKSEDIPRCYSWGPFWIGVVVAVSLVMYFPFNRQLQPVEKHIADLDEDEKKVRFSRFRRDHAKLYTSIEEEEHRYKIFKSNLDLAEQRNQMEKKNGGTAIHGVTKFSDMTTEEFKKTILRYPGEDIHTSGSDEQKSQPRDASMDVESIATPDYYSDWTKGSNVYVTPIKNQGILGSCSLFAATEQLESDSIRLKIGSVNAPLAPQQLVDCYKCFSAVTSLALQWLIDKNIGMVYESEYPYTSGDDGSCGVCDTEKTVSANQKIIPVRVFRVPEPSLGLSVAGTEAAMAQYLGSTGTLTTALDADYLSTYISGVHAACGPSDNRVNHAVQLVGVDTAGIAPGSGGVPSYLVRNSWGTDWGMDGFFRLKYGVGMCAMGITWNGDGVYTTAAVNNAPTLAPNSSPTLAPDSGGVLVTANNWISLMTSQTVRGQYNIVVSGTPPDVQMQLMSTFYRYVATEVYDQYPIQQGSGFVVSFDLDMSGWSADELYFAVGASDVLSCGVSCGAGFNKGAVVIGFDVYPWNGEGAGRSGPGVYLMNSAGAIVASGPFSGDSAWETVTITYTKGITNTWVVTWKGTTVLTYSDPSNPDWVASAGSYWGFGARDGGWTGDFYIRGVSLTLTDTPKTVTARVTANNWASLMTTQTIIGDYNIVVSGTPPDVQMQLMSSSFGGVATEVYEQYPIQQGSGFVVSFDLDMSGWSADELYFAVGASDVLSCGVSCGAGFNKGAVIIGFDVYPWNGGGAGQSGPGVYLMNSAGAIVASGPFSGDSAWETVTITYTKGITNTWVVTWKGTTVLTYSDPSNPDWVASAGSYWGFGARDGGWTGDFYIRGVSLTLIN